MVPVLVDRAVEAEAIGRVLAAAREGLSGVLVLRGEAGIGKTALLDHAVERAGDMLVAGVTGLESEMDLGFAGLHMLLVPFLGGVERLPVPQREALHAAFGMAAGSAPDRFLVGLAALTLITDAAVDRPVLCVVDDAQWLDRVSAEVLGFVARRLFADRVAMLLSVREGDQRTVMFDGLPELTVGGLPEEAAGELLTTTVGRPVDPRVRERVAIETAGNPLAVVEFGGELTTDELSGTAPLTEPLRFGGRLEELYRSRVRALPDYARMMLLVVAADQLGEPGKVREAAKWLGIEPEVAELPAVERLVTWSPRVQFHHPLMRSAAYYAAPVAARRRAHEALAAVSDPEQDPDRRAWHLADAAPGPDEQIAVELVRSADRARSRGGWASGAAFLERAAGLTSDPVRRAQRLLGAAEARFAAGDVPAVRVLLERAAPDLGDSLGRAKARRLEGLTLYAAGEPTEATSVLLDAAQMIEPHDRRLASDTLLDAFRTAQYSGQASVAMAEVLQAVRSTPVVEESQQTMADLLLDGFAAWGEHRYEAGVELLRRATGPLTGDQPLSDDVLHHVTAMALAASLMLDWSVRPALEHRWAQELRRRGALGALLVALVFQVYNQLIEGRFADAEVTLAEGRALCDATGFRAYLGLFAAAELAVAAWQGQEANARPLAAELLRNFTARGYGLGVINVHMAMTWLELGLGHYPEALRGALEIYGNQSTAILELVEAATRCGDRETATAALDAFSPLAVASGTPVALGLLALCRAILAGNDADLQYRMAIEHLRQGMLPPYLARSYLLYGEWLRRQRRRRDAREQLNTAWQMFATLGMDAFAERARAELRATGEHARKRSPDTQDVLTPQETQIAGLVAEGLSNQEIAARLFISASTVEYHLRKIFRKRDVASRVQLAHLLREQNAAPVQQD